MDPQAVAIGSLALAAVMTLIAIAAWNRPTPRERELQREHDQREREKSHTQRIRSLEERTEKQSLQHMEMATRFGERLDTLTRLYSEMNKALRDLTRWMHRNQGGGSHVDDADRE